MGTRGDTREEEKRSGKREVGDVGGVRAGARRAGGWME